MKEIRVSNLILIGAIAFLIGLLLAGCSTQPPGADLWLTV